MRIELCSNREYVDQSLCWNGDGYANDCAVDEYLNVMCRELVAADVEFEVAQGQRILYHGWNGAHFDHRLAHSLVGVFGELDERTAEIITAADHKAREAAFAAAEAVAAQMASDE